MPHTILIFGASGDLTSRKLIPALYQLHRKKRMPDDVRIVGSSRTEFTDESWREKLHESTRQFAKNSFDEESWSTFAPCLHYVPGDISEKSDFERLCESLRELEQGRPVTRIYYLAMSPRFFEPTIDGLGACGMAEESHGDRRIVVEKPFGTNLATARELNATLHRIFDEHQVYRIDHYLGKETVQNMLVFRFANTIFEPIWNRNYIDHVQITAAEEVAIGRRGAMYETTGIIRDMFQNHLLTLLTMTAMEPPALAEADPIRNEKVKVLQAIRRLGPDEVATDTMRGQYDSYREEPGVPEDSKNATFAAVKLNVDNWRWQGVPFYLRSGKAMNCRSTQIVIQFRQPPHMMFESARGRSIDANRLVIQIQPAEGIQVHFQTKVPDAGMKLRLTDLEFRFDSQFQKAMPEAYERLLLDTMMGDASLFARSDEVELSWSIVDPIINAWDKLDRPELAFYEKDTWGPKESNKWIWRDGRDWFDVCPVLPGGHAGEE